MARENIAVNNLQELYDLALKNSGKFTLEGSRNYGEVYLRECGSDYHWLKVELSQVVGNDLKKAWTYRENRYGSGTYVGMRTLASIVMLLDKDLGAKIKVDLKRKADERQKRDEIICRNNLRRQAREMVVNVTNLMTKAADYKMAGTLLEISDQPDEEL